MPSGRSPSRAGSLTAGAGVLQIATAARRRLRWRRMSAPDDSNAGDVTRILHAVHAGEPQAGDELMALVYAELRRIAGSKMRSERPGHTLQPTALVHEAWLRLVDADGRARFENRAHFFSAAGEAMRRILIERARRKLAARHGGGQERVDADEMEIAAPTEKNDELLAVHAALDKLAVNDREKAELVKLRYFVGLKIEEAAEALGISVATANRWWIYARAWLHQEIKRQ